MKKALLCFLCACFTLNAFSACNRNAEKEIPQLYIATSTGDLGARDGYATDESVIYGLYEAGFRYIDFSMYGFSAQHPYMQAGWEAKILHLKTVADTLGMKFVQAHSEGGNPLSSDESEVERLIQATVRSLEICEILGIENTVVHAGYQEGLSKEEWFEKNKLFYDRLLPFAEDCGVNILCENSTRVNMGDNYYINSGADMREFIKYVNNPYFHGCWDTGHGNCEGEQYDDIVALGDEMYAIHYNDNSGYSDAHLMPYCGTLDQDAVMKALIEIGYSGYFTLEATGIMRSQYSWSGPEFPIMTETYPYIPKEQCPMLLDRMQQEKLLYQAMEDLLIKYNMLAN